MEFEITIELEPLTEDDENEKIEFIIQFKITYFSPFVPGKLNGPPENCYPDEGPEVEWMWKFDESHPRYKDIDGWIADHEEEITKKAIEIAEQNARDAKEEAAIDAYEDRIARRYDYV